ncbi:MAG: YegS/Rv2252/BmrU family lipid kinase [Clostridia bacterium]|nr:YegS/Rv2252/BmrU family lipid kinase [Clostridia bacterium]
MKNVLLIINPRAGKTKVKTCLFDIVDILSEHDMTVTVEITRYSGHARDMCSYISDSYDMVICAGGDGTLNEVFAGMISSKKHIPIGYIPAGSTNDFGSTLKLSKDMKKAASDIVTGVTRTIDIGKFDNRFFSYVASFGAFTKASYSTPQEIKNTLGHLAYVLEGMKDLPTIKGEYARIVTDNGTVHEGEFIFGAIANSTSVGGVISLDKRLVTMNDGRFELMLIKNPKNIVELNKCINALLTKNYNTDMIIFDSLRSAEIVTENPLTWSLDGERCDTDGKVSIKNLNNAIRMVLPSTVNETEILYDNTEEADLH